MVASTEAQPEGARNGGRRGAAAVLVAALAGAMIAAVLSFGAGAASAANSADGGGASFGASCEWSHQAARDPITNPNNVSDPDHPVHLHEFFGNRSQDNFTYEAMVRAPSTCNRGNVQGSAYWFPTVRWNGVRLQPRKAIIYYKHNNKRNESIRPFPRDFKMIVDQGEGAIRWSCGNNEEAAQAAPPERCLDPKKPLTVKIRFPDCWDTKSLGTHNNNWRGHVRFSRTGRDGNNHCSDGWRPMAQIQIRVGFHAPNDQGTFPDGPNGGAVTVSDGNDSWAGYNEMHADFWNTWDQGELEFLTRRCINQVDPDADRPRVCQSSKRG